MVAAAIPMSNMNLFSDAMASGKHSDKNDNYQEYESYYSNDKQYTSDYNYYYEPMKQPQSSYGYNTNYVYDDTKQLSYNNSYEDMKKYSTYPTKDKKYVCQTGQFQGFFVESVEFCKLKIAQGPQGIPGPTGPQGIPGPQGHSGLNTINSTNLYLLIGAVNGTIPPATIISSVTCDLGDVIYEDGHTINNFGNTTTIEFSGPDFENPATYFYVVEGNNILIRAHAYCFDNPPTHIP
jgi:hypothetical protein